jgi:lysozyme family protein
MAAPTLTKALRDDYERLYRSAAIRSERQSEVNRIAGQIKANSKRYQSVGKPLGVPWYVVGIIHSLEGSLNFSTHLHNGDPLTARTTRVPAGRPPTGRPPFTWTQSAIDALTMEGFGRWKDWSVPGILFKLEGYNGFGYRHLQAPIPSPYLWSFSSQYTRGKFVADGRFSATAVSAQCGGAVLLMRLQDSGAAAAHHGPRELELTTPHMTGDDVVEAQRLLVKNPFGKFDAGKADGDYGSRSASATWLAKWTLGYPMAQVNMKFGPKLREYLKRSKPLPPDYRQRRQKRSKQKPPEAAPRP